MIGGIGMLRRVMRRTAKATVQVCIDIAFLSHVGKQNQSRAHRFVDGLWWWFDEKTMEMEMPGQERIMRGLLSESLSLDEVIHAVPR
jgi:hypothetical protein